MQKSGASLGLLSGKYCGQYPENGKLSCQSTHLSKYYASYLHKARAALHLEQKPGEALQAGWAGRQRLPVDTDTGGRLDVSLFVAVLPYSGYTCREAFLQV